MERMKTKFVPFELPEIVTKLDETKRYTGRQGTLVREVKNTRLMFEVLRQRHVRSVIGEGTCGEVKA